MTPLLFIHTLALTFAANTATVQPAAMRPSTQGLIQIDSVALHARFDPSLGALRAGRVDAPAPFGATERTEFAAAQQNSRSLEALRAGFDPSNNEWKWLGIGAGIVLLIVLL